MRALRLGLALAIGWQAIVMHEWLMLAAAGWLAAMAIFGLGCCVPARTNIPGSIPENTTYEEVDH